MKFLLVISLLASIAAPLRSGAEELKGAASAAVHPKAPKEQAATGRLTLVGEVKNRADVVHFFSYWCGAGNPDPRFDLWVPTELRTEYDAIPTETEKFAWLADHLRSQSENGDVLSGNDLGILHLYGLGVEKDWKKAHACFVEPIKKGRWVGQRCLAELLVMSSEQPQNARLAAGLLTPMLKAGNRYGIWAAFEADKILEKSEDPEDKALATQLVVLCAEMIEKQLKSPPSDVAERGFLCARASRVAEVLLDNDNEVNRRLAESLIATWLLSEPKSVEAKIRSLGLRVVQKDLEKQWSEANALLTGGGLDENSLPWVKRIRVRSGIKTGKLFTELSWSEVIEVAPQKYQNMFRFLPVIGFGFLLVLLSGLCLWTRFRKKPHMGFLLLLVWLFGFLIAELILFGSPIAVFIYCPIALFLLWFGLRGPNPFPYLVSPQEKYGSFKKTWLEIGGACVLLYAVVYALGIGYCLLYQWISGAEPPRQAIVPFLISNGLSGKIAAILAVGIFMPALEEIVFRGFLHDWLSRKLPLAAAMILGSLLFGFMHGIDYGLPLTGLGLACLWLRIRYQSLIPSILLHALNNIVSIILINL